MYVGGNVMLLDEPTNHLDVYTREALEEALENFTGALIVVSHDRYFIDRVAENIILVEDGSAEVYAGNYIGAGGAVQGRRGDAGEGAGVAARPRTAVAADSTRHQQPATPRRRTRRSTTREEQKQRDKRIKKIDEEIAAARGAHRLGRSGARAQRSAALLPGSLPRRRARRRRSSSRITISRR